MHTLIGLFFHDCRSIVYETAGSLLSQPRYLLHEDGIQRSDCDTWSLAVTRLHFLHPCRFPAVARRGTVKVLVGRGLKVERALLSRFNQLSTLETQKTHKNKQTLRLLAEQTRNTSLPDVPGTALPETLMYIFGQSSAEVVARRVLHGEV